MNVNLYKVPEPAEGTAAVLITDRTDSGFYFYDASGNVNLLCGHCGRTLARGLEAEKQLSSLVFKCPDCQKFSATRM